MTPEVEAKKESYAEKINKLLRKAESTTPEEAEALLSKAQELMTTWAIDEEMLAKFRGEKVIEKIIEKTIRYTGIYHQAQYDIGSEIAQANDCRTLISRSSKWTTLWVLGFKSDVNKVVMLDSSLQIQAAQALNAWWRNEDVPDWYTAMEKYKARRSFLFGFAEGLESQLWKAKQAGEAQAIKNEAERSEATQEEASTSVALVLKTKRQKMDEWYDKEYGHLKAGKPRNYSGGGWGAQNAGYSAGQKADVGRDKLSSRKQLGS